jgi:hypothetical protein
MRMRVALHGIPTFVLTMKKKMQQIIVMNEISGRGVGLKPIQSDDGHIHHQIHGPGERHFE